MERERRSSLLSRFLNKVLNRDPPILGCSSKNILRHYEIGQVLGAGSFGTTYLCRDRKTGVKYACKSIPTELIKSDLLPIAYLRREVAVLKSLPSHPNIVSLKETFEDKQNVHLIMELCKGRELFEKVQASGRFHENEAKGLLRSIVHVIQWCHIHGVMHRDIKPENFMITRNNTIKAIDFGFAVIFKPGQRFHDLTGSPTYMAPEVFLQNYGPEADVWSAGVVFYFILSGHLPFPSAGDQEMLKEKICTSRIDFGRTPWPQVFEGAKNLLKGMLNCDYKKRLTPRQILDHPWLRNENGASNLKHERPLEEGYSYRTTSAARPEKNKLSLWRLV